MVGKWISTIATLFICTVMIDGSIQAQPGQATSPFLREPNRPFVYLKFDHIGTGVQRRDNEPSSRIWLQFVNNRNVPILLHANGVPDGSLAGEVGVMDDVVPDRPLLTMLTITSEEALNMEAKPEAPTQGKPVGTVIDQRQQEMPSGYTAEVGSAVRVAPGQSVLFSVSTNHLGTKDGRWHMEVPFWFATPKGRGPRDPVIGGEPLMSLWYSIYDLPDEARAALTKQE